MSATDTITPACRCCLLNVFRWSYQRKICGIKDAARELFLPGTHTCCSRTRDMLGMNSR